MTFFLAMNAFPEVQKKAQEELDRVIGSGRLPVSADRDNLPYIMAVMKETHRWHPVAPMGLPHTSTAEDVCQGYRIPKGAMLMPNTWYVRWNVRIHPVADKNLGGSPTTPPSTLSPWPSGPNAFSKPQPTTPILTHATSSSATAAASALAVTSLITHSLSPLLNPSQCSTSRSSLRTVRWWSRRLNLSPAWLATLFRIGRRLSRDRRCMRSWLRRLSRSIRGKRVMRRSWGISSGRYGPCGGGT